MNRRSPSRRRKEPERVVPVEISDERRVEFHFPVEIHMDEPPGDVDVHAIAQQVFERLVRRIDET